MEEPGKTYMGYYYSYDRRHPPLNRGPLPYPVLLLLLITAVSMALSKLLAFDSLFEASELNVGLLVLLVLILAAVHFLSSMDRRRKLYGPVPCYRCWNAQCYGC